MDKLLRIFIENPEKEFHIREIARMTRKSPTTATKQLNQLSKRKILLKERKLNHVLFKANIENEEYKLKKLKENLSFIKGEITPFLVEKFNYPEAIILFGSYAKAENNSNSDIDILIVSSSKKELKIKDLEKKVSKKIQLFIYSNKELEKIRSKNPELLNNLINGIVIYGFWEVFK